MSWGGTGNHGSGVECSVAEVWWAGFCEVGCQTIQ